MQLTALLTVSRASWPLSRLMVSVQVPYASSHTALVSVTSEDEDASFSFTV